MVEIGTALELGDAAPTKELEGAALAPPAGLGVAVRPQPVAARETLLP